MRPVFPSCTRSSRGIWERPYLRATETTSRRLAVMKCFIAASPSAAIVSKLLDRCVDTRLQLI